MATILMGSIPDLYDDLLANLDTVYWMQREIAMDGMRFYNKQTGLKDVFVNETTVSGFGDVPVKEEGENSSSDVLYQGYDKKYSPTVRSLMYKVSQEAVLYNKWMNLAKNAKALERSFRHTKEVRLARPVNYGFDTVTSADGSYLFATDHSLLPGGTQKNTLSTQADLSVTSLRTALNDYADTTDYRGLRLNLKAGRLVVPVELKWLAWELTNSVGKPDTANRADNAFKNEGLSVEVWGYLTDSDGWGLMPAQNSDHGLNYKEWEAFQTYADYDFDSDSLKFKGRESYDIGVTDWTGLFFVEGA